MAVKKKHVPTFKFKVALVKSGDFEECWAFHLGEEYKRNYAKKYAEPERLKYKGLKIMEKPL